MRKTTPTVDDLAELCAALARDEVFEIMEEIYVDDLTACEMVALLTVLRPVRERKRLSKSRPRLCLRWCRDRTGTTKVHDRPHRSSPRLGAAAHLRAAADGNGGTPTPAPQAEAEFAEENGPGRDND